MTKHAKERDLQRYNLYLSENDKKHILQMLRNNQFMFLGDSHDANRKFGYVTYNNIPLKVLYYKTSQGVKSIVTVYPFDVEEYNALMSSNFESKINMAAEFLKSNGYIVYKRKGLTIPKSMTNT